MKDKLGYTSKVLYGFLLGFAKPICRSIIYNYQANIQLSR